MAKSSLSFFLRKNFLRAKHFLIRDIWSYANIQDRSLRGNLMAFLRMISICVNGIIENRIFARAAALSYSSLIALGPLLAIVVLVSGAFLKGNPEDNIKKALIFVAPTLQDYVTLEASGEFPDDTQTPLNEDEVSQMDMANALDLLISQITTGAEQMVKGVETKGKGIAGGLGILTIILIGIQLLTTIETTFNFIWGVKQGRSWSQRVVFYWTIITLGVFLGLAALGLFSASSFVGAMHMLPLGEELTRQFLFLSQFFSLLVIALLLTLFYQFFPNTKVRFIPALIGGITVTLLLFINNSLSILYINKVIQMQSLYGSLGIIPVLMFGFYLFWACILTGGQITFAAQNVVFLTNQKAWNRISSQMKMSLSLATYLLICRRFNRCEPAYRVTELVELMRVPGNVLNKCLDALIEMNLISRGDVQDQNHHVEEAQFLPACPLDKISLKDFYEAYEHMGTREALCDFKEVDPLIGHFEETLKTRGIDALGEVDLGQLLQETDAA